MERVVWQNRAIRYLYAVNNEIIHLNLIQLNMTLINPIMSGLMLPGKGLKKKKKKKFYLSRFLTFEQMFLELMINI